jgi:hypothetical protein
MHRLRAGEWVAMLGSVGLLVMLFLDWFRVDGHKLGWTSYTPVGMHATPLHESGWGSLGWLMVLAMCVAILGGLSFSYMTARRTAPAWPVGAGVLTWTVGSLVFLVLLLRVTLLQPGLGAHVARGAVSVQLPAYLGLVFAALIPIGAWFGLRDDRTHTAESLAYTPPPARPVPGT